MINIDKKEMAVAYIQLNVILSNLPEEQLSKIPAKIINEIRKYKSNKYVYKYDYSKPLVEQKMDTLTKEMLYYLYNKYLEIENKPIENEITENKKLNELFENNNLSKEIEEEKSLLPSIKVKEKNIFQKILDFFRKILNK